MTGTKWCTLAVLAAAFELCPSLAADQGKKWRLIQLDPRHSHATAIQAESSERLSDEVYVYSPGCPELDQHLARIQSYNSRKERPTGWKEVVYTGSDYLRKMREERKGDLVVLSGNNRIKIDYIEECVRAGLHVFADKPVVIDPQGFQRLLRIEAEARRRKVLLWDMMSERYSYYNILQAELMRDRRLFGELQRGTAESPAVEETNVHVYGNGRPVWFYDVEQQGEAVPDVGTHLVDLTFWKCFPETALDYRKDLQVDSARHWPLTIELPAFLEAVSIRELPDYLRRCLTGSTLQITTNGSVGYRIRGIHARVTSLWFFRAADNRSGEERSSAYHGTKSTLSYEHRKLWARKESGTDEKEFRAALQAAVERLQAICPGVSLSAEDASGRVEIRIPPGRRHPMNETGKFLEFLDQGKMPAWESPNLLAKYYVTTRALELARAADR